MYASVDPGYGAKAIYMYILYVVCIVAEHKTNEKEFTEYIPVSESSRIKSRRSINL